MMRFGQVTCAFSIEVLSVSKLSIISGTLFSFLLLGSTIKSVKTVIQNGLNVVVAIFEATSNRTFNSNLVSAETFWIDKIIVPINKNENNFIFQWLKTDWWKNVRYCQLVTFRHCQLFKLNQGTMKILGMPVSCIQVSTIYTQTYQVTINSHFETIV